jgi:hypothetical protein
MNDNLRAVITYLVGSYSNKKIVNSSTADLSSIFQAMQRTAK